MHPIHRRRDESWPMVSISNLSPPIIIPLKHLEIFQTVRDRNTRSNSMPMGATLMRLDLRYLKPKSCFEVFQFHLHQHSAVFLYIQGFELQVMTRSSARD